MMVIDAEAMLTKSSPLLAARLVDSNSSTEIDVRVAIVRSVMRQSRNWRNRSETKQTSQVVGVEHIAIDKL